MRKAGERGAELGLELSLELLASMLPYVDGTYVMPSFGRYELAAELVRRIRGELLDPVEAAFPVAAGAGPAGVPVGAER
jgi:hypothetical protein